MTCSRTCIHYKKETEKIHERGQHVFFISDMYLPFDFIQNVLEEKGLYNEGGGLSDTPDM